MSTKKVTILRGLPGSGKSSFCNNFPVVCSADHFVDYSNFHFSQVPPAHHKCMAKFIKSCQDGMKHIVVDNTNTHATEIAPYVLVGESFGYEVEILFFDTPIGVCKERNAMREGGRRVPDAVIDRMANTIKTESFPPWWKQRAFDGVTETFRKA